MLLYYSESSSGMVFINWLRNTYEEIWVKMMNFMETSCISIQMQALTTAIRLMAVEGKSPVNPVANVEYYFPIHRLKQIIMKILSPEKENLTLITKFLDMTIYSDALYFTWKCLPSLTPKRQPQNIYIKNLLELLHKLPQPRENTCKNH
jgi:U3 small nucleolar RNA-associated protein 19